MKNMKKLILVLIILAGIAVGGLFAAPGFEKRTDVCLTGFSLSEDGSVITVKTALAGSMGYVRGIKTEQSGHAIHCSFYGTFGGLNSNIGARSSFEIKLEDTAEKIYFDRGGGDSCLVLERDPATHVWVQK